MNARPHAKIMESTGVTVLAEPAAQVERRARWYCTPVARQCGQQWWIEHREPIAAIADGDERPATETRAAASERRAPRSRAVARGERYAGESHSESLVLLSMSPRGTPPQAADTLSGWRNGRRASLRC